MQKSLRKLGELSRGGKEKRVFSGAPKRGSISSRLRKRRDQRASEWCSPLGETARPGGYSGVSTEEPGHSAVRL